MATARSVYRRIARNLQPEALPAKLPHPKPGAPYTETECAQFITLAWHQPSKVFEPRIAFIIGLGLGAGLDAVDFRHLTAAHLEKVAIDGHDVFLVHVPGVGLKARTVAVRSRYVPLIQRALAAHERAGLGPGDLVVSTCPTAINVTSPALASIRVAGEYSVRITTARLRHTWLVAAMTAPISFADLMSAAGLRSARNLTELLEHCPTPDPSHAVQVQAELAQIAYEAGQA